MMKDKNTKKLNVKVMTMIALMTAVLCVVAPFTVPIGPIPISLATFVIYIAALLLGWKYGTASCLLYLLIGLIGIPVFSGFSGGPGKLLGPTGGYLIGYLFMAMITGIFVEKFPGRKLMHGLGMALGTVVTYIIGTLWLAYQAGMGFGAALGAGVIPFIPGDVVKIVLAVWIGTAVKKQLIKSGVLSQHTGVLTRS